MEIFSVDLFSSDRAEYNVVVLPEPVGPVTRHIPKGFLIPAKPRVVGVRSPEGRSPKAQEALRKEYGGNIGRRVVDFDSPIDWQVHRRSGTEPDARLLRAHAILAEKFAELALEFREYKARVVANR